MSCAKPTKCATCDNEALLCGDCINAGNETLKRDLASKNALIKETLATIEEVRQSRFGDLGRIYLDAIECALKGVRQP